MRVLVATNDLQGTVEGDYAWTVEGELVTPLVVECRSGDRCGCARGFPGLASDRATTTAMVVDRPGVSEHDLGDAVRDYLDRAGWIDLFEQAAATADHGDDGDDSESFLGEFHDVHDLIDSLVEEHVDAILQVCDEWPTGTIVQRRGDFVWARSYPAVA